MSCTPLRTALLSTLTIASTAAADLPATDPAIRYIGRWSTTPVMSSVWPTSTMRVRFTGASLAVQLRSNTGDCRVQVVVDGVAGPAITLLKEQDHWFDVAKDLAPGDHVVELVKATESFTGTFSVRSVRLADGGTLLPALGKARMIECLGDSITAGYGVEAASEKEKFSPTQENAWLTFGAIAARRLDADYVCAAVSGIRVSGDDGLPTRWNQLNPFDVKKEQWSNPDWQPQAVVVNLGTNDVNHPTWSAATYQADFGRFLTELRSHYPTAHLFVTCAPMGALKAQAVLPAIVKTANDPKIHLLDLPNQDAARDGLGADWHPSRKTQQVMADHLIQALITELGWK